MIQLDVKKYFTFILISLITSVSFAGENVGIGNFGNNVDIFSLVYQNHKGIFVAFGIAIAMMIAFLVAILVIAVKTNDTENNSSNQT